MPHVLNHHPPPPVPTVSSEPVPPIPPRTRSRLRSTSIPPNPPKSSFFRLDELPAPDREWQLLENIGDGTYGEVFRAKHIRNPDFYAAVKIMHPTNEVLEEIEQEYRVLFELSSHGNLCRFYGAYLKRASSPPPPRPPPPRTAIASPTGPGEKTTLLSVETTSMTSFVSLPLQLDQLWLVMELCTSGSVTDLTKSTLKANQRLDETIIAYILRETCNALHYLHSNNVIHRDVKGHNILITGDGHIKLIDFGVSAYVSPYHGRRNTSVGTPFFMAPEVIACERQMDYDYDARADVWSTGITAIEMAEGEPPLAEMHPMRALVAIPRNPPPSLRQPYQWSSAFNDFIRQCLIKNFEARPSVGQMLEHTFLTEIPTDGIEARRRIVQIVQRYKRCYDLCAKKTSRETCGIKNGHIRGKSETCSSIAIEAAADSSAVDAGTQPSKRVVPAHVGKPSHETPKRPAPPPPVPTDNGSHTPSYKTKRKSQSRRHQKQAQVQANQPRLAPDDRPVRHPSLSKKSIHQQFYNSTYDVTYPNLSASSSCSTNDLAQLESFDEQSIITCIYHRFLANQIYTYIGDILVAINPFRSLPIYGPDVMARYRSSIKSEQAPHIYGLADLAYQAMLHDAENQYIVISGESGSGKTQSANFLVQQLTYLGNAPNKRLQEKILQINPLIEGFGNARTIINDNSSRFGKYLEMLFTREGRVTGARLSEYLLEKTRVVNQGRAERNFHIFYYLFHGLASAKSNDEQAFYLSKTQTYRYLKTDLEDQDNLKENFQSKFRTIEKCFEIIGFQKDEVTSIYRILAGLLHLGNMNFHQNEGHFIDGKTCVSDRYLLNIVCELFGLDTDAFDIALTTCNIVTRGETIQRSTTLQESQSTRDAMAKALYNRLFSWIVNRISALLAPSAVAMPEVDRLVTEDESSIYSHGENHYNINNNNNQEDPSDNEIDDEGMEHYQSNQTMITSFPPPTVMCAMRRTLDYLDMTPSSSSFLLQLQQSDDDIDDDDEIDGYELLNTNNNNNYTLNNPSPPPNPTPTKSINHRASNSINDLNNHSCVEATAQDDKPVQHLIDNWTRAVAAASSNRLQKSPSFNAAHRAISETNLALRRKTVENNAKRHHQSSIDLSANTKQSSSFVQPSNGNVLPEETDCEALKISILDIFGFENFSSNTFEQLCINITNEQIQYYFNQHVFACERQEYLNENLTILPLPATMDLTFYDNRPLLEMFLNKPVGILALLDEESRFPKATDYTLVDKLNANYSGCPLYVRSKASFSSSSISSSSSSTSPSVPSFSIIHFAGQVQYDARGFLEKNRDYLAPEIIQTFRSSRVPLISSLFHFALSKTGTIQAADHQRLPSATMESNQSLDLNPILTPLNASHNRVQATVSTYFRYSLTDLFSKMIRGSPKFVRCFKPNNDRIAGCFEAQTVLEQLKYSGILAAAQIRRYGFSHRIPFANFIQRYSILVYPVTMDLPLTREICEAILHKLNMQNWTMGKSKVFLKYYHAEQLTRLHSTMLSGVITIQSAARMYLARLQRKQLQYRHPNALMIEELHRHPKFSRPTKISEGAIGNAVVCIQSCIRGHLQRHQIRRWLQQPRTEEEAAIIIQKYYRGFRFRKTFSLYKQRLDIQTLCFLQQVELINHDFYTKIVRTNYCVPIKSIDSLPNPPLHQNYVKPPQKSLSYFFPPPPPLPLPSPYSGSTVPDSARNPISTNGVPPLASSLSTAFLSSRQRTHRSPSPLPSTSKFAQVRDVFARAQPAAAHPPVVTKHLLNTAMNTALHTLPSADANRTLKLTTVLNAVQEYQRQHIKASQPSAKRFAHLGAGALSNACRSTNLAGRSSRPTGPANVKSNLSIQALPSPKAPPKSNSQENALSLPSNSPFHVLLRKTGQDLITGQTLTKRSAANESKQIDFRSILRSRHTLNGTTDNETITRSNSLSQGNHLEGRLRFNDI